MNALSARCDGENLDVSSSIIRQKLKVTFLEQEKAEILARIKDLEASLAINKQIIRDLCDGSFSEHVKYKQAVQKLNNENINLHQTVNKITKEKKEYEGQKLIYTQVIEEHKKKEAELIEEWKDKVSELLDQLNKKEYLLQVEEKKSQDMERLLLKYLKNVPEIKTVLPQKNTSHAAIGISNVVIENQHLQARVNELRIENNRLKKELESSELRILIATLKEKITSLVKENEKQRKKIEEREKNNMELYELNEKLTSQLENMNKQVNVLIHSQRIMQTEVLHSAGRDPPQVFFTQDVATNKKNMSFGELSSISDNGCDEPQESSSVEGQGNVCKEGKSVEDNLRVELKENDILDNKEAASN